MVCVVLTGNLNGALYFNGGDDHSFTFRLEKAKLQGENRCRDSVLECGGRDARAKHSHRRLRFPEATPLPNSPAPLSKPTAPGTRLESGVAARSRVKGLTALTRLRSLCHRTPRRYREARRSPCVLECVREALAPRRFCLRLCKRVKGIKGNHTARARVRNQSPLRNGSRYCRRD